MNNKKGLTLIEVIVSVTILTMVVLVFTVGMKSIIDMNMREKIFTKLSSQAYSDATTGSCSISSAQVTLGGVEIETELFTCSASSGDQSVTYTFYKWR